MLDISDRDGKTLGDNIALELHYTFTGREWNAENSLYHARAREYDPSVGRFLQQDPYKGKKTTPVSIYNKYTYVYNNPNMFFDSTGEKPFASWRKSKLSVTSDGINIQIPAVYGSYCGPYSNDGKDLSKPAKDGPDRVCKEHDQNYVAAEKYESGYWESNTFFAPELAVVAETGHYFYHRMLADGEFIFEAFNHNSWKNDKGHHDVAQMVVVLSFAAVFAHKYYSMGADGLSSADQTLFMLDKQGTFRRYLDASVKRIGRIFR